MAGRIKPREAKELRQAVEWALNDGVTLDVRGQGSKLALGKPMRCDQVLDLSGLSGRRRLCAGGAGPHPPGRDGPQRGRALLAQRADAGLRAAELGRGSV